MGVATIEGSITLENMPIEFIGLGAHLKALASPDKVDVILSGPLPVLDSLTSDDVHIVIDLSGVEEGTYQRMPHANITISDVNLLASILPGSIEVTVSRDTKTTVTPTVTPQPTTNGG